MRGIGQSFPIFDRIEPNSAHPIPLPVGDLAAAIRRRPDYWDTADLALAAADMKLEAVNSGQVETILRMIQARSHLIHKFLSGNLLKDDHTASENFPQRPNIASAPMQFDGKQELFEAAALRCLDESLSILNCTDDDQEINLEQLRDKKINFAKPVAVTGPPGSGKTTRASSLRV